MPPLAPGETYGVREQSLRGAPMTRAQWEHRHKGHDVRTWIQAAEPTAFRKAACFTCWVEAIERPEPGDIPLVATPTVTPPPTAAPQTPDEGKTTTTKGNRK